MTNTWNVEWITFTLGYILQRSCWPSFVRICCTIKSIATWFSPPRGMITSANFFDGRIKLSKAGLTNFAYCKPNEIQSSIISYRVIEIRTGIRHQTTIQFRKFSKPNRHMPHMKEKEKEKEFLKIDPHHCRNANGIFQISCRLWFPQIPRWNEEWGDF